MFKNLLSMVFVLLLCFGMAACVENINNGENGENGGNGGGDSEELASPVLEWWELYNPNGFDTFTGAIYNPNDISVEVSFDIVFYKGGKEVARCENWSCSGILPGGKSLVWANSDIPKSSDADDVKMENVKVVEASCKPIDGKYEYAGTTDGYAYFNFTFGSKPKFATIWFVLYADKNGNKKFDKGEIVVTSMASLTDKTGTVSFQTTGYDWTDYEVYFSAY